MDVMGEIAIERLVNKLHEVYFMRLGHTQLRGGHFSVTFNSIPDINFMPEHQAALRLSVITLIEDGDIRLADAD